jgi:hypothetical protein
MCAGGAIGVPQESTAKNMNIHTPCVRNIVKAFVQLSELVVEIEACERSFVSRVS